MRKDIVRSTLAVLLAPALAAGLFSAVDLVQRPEIQGAFTPFYFAFAYATALPAGAVAMVFLKAWRLTRLWHFACAGLLAGIICVVFTIDFMGPQAMFAMLTIGPLVGIFVWFVSEWNGTETRRSSSRHAD